MDIAIVVNSLRENSNIRNIMLRPFADASLLEIAVEKLSHLDAPCRKYVAVTGKDMRVLVSQFSGLSTLKCSPEQIGARVPLDVEYSHLKNLPESWFLVVDPTFPLIQGEQWWEAIEAFLAREAGGLVSATRIEENVFREDGSALQPFVSPPVPILAANGAFKIVSREAIFAERSFWPKGSPAPMPFEVARTSAWQVRDMEDLSAVEAVYSMVQLGFLA